MSSPHALTLVRCAPALVLAKTWRADGSCEGYDRPRRVDLAEMNAPDIGALHGLLEKLLDRPRVCVLRGAIADPARARGVRRLVHPDPKTGEQPTLRAVPRAWVALDMDDVPLPEYADVHDLAACGEVALGLLPEAFRNATHVIQATAGHGIRAGARLRLWFTLTRAITGAELRQWLAAAPIDPSVFGAAQPIYTAAPRFVGMGDPLPSRLLLRPGAEAVQVPPPLTLAPLPPRPAAPLLSSDHAAGYGAHALAAAAARITTAGEGARHWTAVRQAKHLGRLAVQNIVSEREVILLIESALDHAGKTRAEGRAIAEWGIAWARGTAA
jgi:hypothetical protein